MTIHSISGLNGQIPSSVGTVKQAENTPGKSDFGKAILNSLEQVNKQQSEADASIVDLLSGKQQDVNTVVANVAKADMSFKLLVGVRNKLVEAYKETMRMQI